jgi:RND family efflux transporter MFP subunit
MMKRKVLFIGGLIVILVIAGYFGWQRLTTTTTTTAAIQTANVSRGSLTATVSAAGNISAPEEAVLAFQTSGRVTQVNVQVGDAVKKGQVLMQLETADLEASLKTAELNLVNTQASYDSAKLKNDQNPNQLLVAKVALDKALIALQKAQSDYNAVAWRPDVGMMTQSQTLQSASIDYQSALANYQITASTINDTALKQAQIQLDSAKISVEQAQRNLDKAKIVAPFDGVVAAVNFSVGDTASGSAVTIVDMSQLQIKVTVAEVDIAKIKVGQTAQMTLDALTGKTYNAKVLSVAPVATVTQGVVNYSVTLTVSDNDGSIKPGMTSNLTIVVEQRDNVLLVPLRAVKTQGNQKTITLVRDGKNVTLPVTVGLSNESSVEITSNGLAEGDRVVINQTTTRSTTGGAPSGPGGLGIPGF